QLRRSGQILLLHLGLGPDALGVVSSDVYRDKVLQGVSGTPQAGVVRRFLEEVVAPCPRLSYERESGLGDDDVTQLVAAGVLTVRDAGSWWLALPGIGRFIRALLRGRRALLAVVRRSRNHEVLQGELLQRRAPPGTQLGVPYLLYDLLGAHLLCRYRPLTLTLTC
ncbi:STK19 kinase, partial [Rhinopomastus cyanomelas]|nr:STK19 kinase [Rhinopomastus cyanomelas]